MTSPYVTFPRPAQPAPRPSAWPVLRALLAAVLVLAGLVGFVVAGFVALVTWTGCFIECTGGNHRAGGALALLAIVLVAGGPAINAAMYRSRVWLWVAVSAAALGATVLVLLVSAN
jgi:hypothetical protein